VAQVIAVATAFGLTLSVSPAPVRIDPAGPHYVTVGAQICADASEDCRRSGALLPEVQHEPERTDQEHGQH
jgi:hypothetical protein